MTITSASYEADGSVKAGLIEGQTWSGITPESRFWGEVQAWVLAGNTITPYIEPEPQPVDVQPTRIACALRIPVVDGEVQQIGGAYRVMAMVLLDVGTFLAIFSQDLGLEPFVIPNNGVSVEITEWGGEYALIEVRDHAGGSLITPASFGFSLYQVQGPET